jgi:hypothetical protein
MSGDEAEKMLEEVTAKLGEHFDAVQILATWNEDGVTKLTNRGAGNWYARQGMAHQFITTDIAQDQAFQIAERLKEKPDDSDDWKTPTT